MGRLPLRLKLATAIALPIVGGGLLFGFLVPSLPMALGATAILIGLGVIAWGILTRSLGKPMLALAEAARAINPAGYDLGAVSKRADEFGGIARAFERLRETAVAMTDEADKLANCDPLPGLANRTALRETLERVLTRAPGAPGNWGVLVLGVDDFQRINATLGHDAGDEVLIQLARRYESCLALFRDATAKSTPDGTKPPPEQAARFGGDEFAFLLSGENVRDRAQRLAESLLSATQDPLLAAGRRVVLNASVGIALCPDDGTDARTLLKCADIAVAQAKTRGKNTFRFSTELVHRAVEDRLALEHDLRHAITRGLIEVQYQPIVSLSDEGVRGAEALARWNHPQRGMVPPALFIGLAEEFGLIDELGLYVLKRACRDAAQWPDVDGEVPFLSVNLSPRQLRAPDLARKIGQALRDTKVEAARIHLELTESVLMDDEPASLTNLLDLHKLGARIWLDDFGTGFSGLPHLRRVPVDGLKVDRSFVQDLLSDRHNLALVSAIITMANSLGIAVVAEGVENAAQAEVLRSLLCDLGQGYWLGPPMSQAQFLLTVRRQKRNRAEQAAP
jgi:predicted signal transduction protein with EAL and GGDEF domain